MRILYHGDSITDTTRYFSDIDSLGQGYPRYSSKYIKEMFPEVEFEFLNRGRDGDKVADLLERNQKDVIDVQPDLITILIGVNDTWHRAETKEWLDNEVFENQYRTLLEEIKAKTNAKIIIMEPFLLPAPDKAFFREDIDPKIHIIRKLATEYADAYIPLDGLLASYWVNEDYKTISEDGVHPSYDYGADIIGKIHADYASKIIAELVK